MTIYVIRQVVRMQPVTAYDTVGGYGVHSGTDTRLWGKPMKITTVLLAASLTGCNAMIDKSARVNKPCWQAMNDSIGYLGEPTTVNHHVFNSTSLWTIEYIDSNRTFEDGSTVSDREIAFIELSDNNCEVSRPTY